MDTKKYIVLINGPIASGKTSVAQSLAKQWDKGVHLDVDIIRNFVKGGFIEEDILYKNGDVIKDRFQLKIQAIKATIQVATFYVGAGYNVFISDPIYLKEIEDVYRTGLSGVNDASVLYLYLQEDYSELMKRVRTRSTPENEPDSKVRHFCSLFEAFDKTNWHVIPTNNLSKEEVLEAVLQKINQL